jgi:hypothetical protein
MSIEMVVFRGEAESLWQLVAMTTFGKCYPALWDGDQISVPIACFTHWPLSTHSSESFSGWGVRAPWCPLGWCVSGDLLGLAIGTPECWDLGFMCPTHGPHSECWCFPQEDTAAAVCSANPTHCWSWLQQISTQFDCTTDNKLLSMHLTDLKKCPQWKLLMLADSDWKSFQLHTSLRWLMQSPHDSCDLSDLLLLPLLTTWVPNSLLIRPLTETLHSISW